MAYSNPFQNAQNPFMQVMSQRRPALKIDPEQFKQFAVTLDDTSLNQFAQQARSRGISEQDIQQGIQFIKSL